MLPPEADRQCISLLVMLVKCPSSTDRNMLKLNHNWECITLIPFFFNSTVKKKIKKQNISYLNLSWIAHFCLSSLLPVHFTPIETTTILFPDCCYSCLQIFLFTVLFYSLPSVTLFPIAVGVTYTSD